ncbi:VpsF family polysaccharide biosynthesis protein [Methylobacterium sp. Leaf466]|uniref:VpsF family polysaccharide biosynthesis protein n=1 Tax=Methylobacterium sp. Leaf466 TaxID=1736386 RepID=UPI000AA0923F|nr:VpsF family polysaccharide biosynthesis protein [Methylobacterium sp. Leaf466]
MRSRTASPAGPNRTPAFEAPVFSAQASRPVSVRRSAPVAALVLTTVLLFGVSGGMLWYAGLNYDGLSGSAAAKIHPATYCAVLLFAWSLLTNGDPVGFLVRSVQACPASLFLLVVALSMAAHIALRGASGLAGSIDTYVGPALLVPVMANLDGRGLRRMEQALHLVMLANALLGLAEFLTGTLVFPYRFDGAVFPTDTRSAALQGHPLVNATVTGLYLMALQAGGGSAIPAALRLPMIALQLVALVTFGGRSAIVACLVFGGAYALVQGLRVLRSGRVPLLGAGIFLVVLAVAPVAVVGLAVGGFFDKLLQRFVSDGGSANARVEMFELFGRIPLRDLMFGPDTALVDSLRRISGLEWGIENPIIRMVLYQGVFMTALLTIAVVLFMTEVIRRCRPGTALPVIVFALLLNTSESIAGKTTLMMKFAVLMLVMFRPLPPGDRVVSARRR